MSQKTFNQKVKAEITELLKDKKLYINDVLMPILGKDNKGIFLRCNDSAISEIEPDFGIKK